MAVVSYTGLPGHGKSYSVVNNVILPALEKGRRVVTNIPLNEDEFTKRLGHKPEIFEFDVDRALQESDYWDTLPKGAIFVLDEVWRIWPAGKLNIPEQHKSFLAEHRHNVDAEGNSAQVVLVTQDLTQIAKFARILVEETFIVTKLVAVGSSTRYRVDVYRGGQNATEAKKSDLLRSFFGRFDSEGFKLYQSHTLAESDDSLVGGVNEAKIDGRSSIWKRPLILGIPLFIVVALVAGYLSYQKLRVGIVGGDSLEKQKHPEPVIESKPTQQLQPTPQKSVPSTPLPEPKYSHQWRLAGVVLRGDRHGFAVLVGRSGYRRVDIRHCRRNLDFECIVDGETVSRYTGLGLFSAVSSPVENQQFTQNAGLLGGG